MPIATRTFRIFVSSTFEDLKAERNALAAPGGPFAELTKVCQSFGARFQAIDLRWGVREEAGLDQRTMEICLGEIERCQRTGIKPNFIVLLGDRYGWRPLPARIEAEEFRAVREHIADAEDRAQVDDWYQLDENAVPAEYLLKPRTGEFEDIHCWGEVETPMHRVLREAARAVGLPGDDLIKYEASATHQEILKGLGKTAEDRQHVFAFFCKPSEPYEDPDLTKLKQFLRDELKGEVFEPHAASELCDRVRENLERVIRAEAAAFQSRPALDLEVEAHDMFARDRARHFMGRKDVLDSIDQYVKGGDRRPVVVHGASGSGKSAVMARALEPLLGNPGNAVVIRRFIGVTPESSSGITLLRSLCEEIGRRYGVGEEIPVEFHSVVRTFTGRLALATADRPLVLFIDALDQSAASDPAADMTWLMTELPPHCRMVLSTTDVARSLEGARRLELGTLPAKDAEGALALWLHDAGRDLRAWQREKVLAYYSGCGLPLYLRLAFEESRRWKSFNELEACALREGLAGIIDVLLQRLSSGSNHGKFLVSRGLGYLATARYGLTEDEMLDVLTEDEAVWQEFDAAKRHDPPERRLPVIVWSRLFLDLEPYLTERVAPGGTVVFFYHRQLPEQIAARFLDESQARLRHEALANHFGHLPTLQPGINLRKISELPYHETLAGLWDSVEKTLSDLEFGEAKIAADMLYDLIQDCDRVLDIHEAPVVKVMRRALALALPDLSQRPDLALQTLYNRLAWLPESGQNWQPILKSAEARLNSRSLWVRAEGPLPGSAIGVVFAIDSTWQFLRESQDLIIAVSRDGEVETRRFDSGCLVSRRRLAGVTILNATACPDRDRIAWLDAASVLHAEGSNHILAGQRSDAAPIWHLSERIVSVTSDDTLIAWDPVDGHTSILLCDVPKPVRVLKTSADRRSLILAAGNKSSLVVLFTHDEKGWHSCDLSLNCGPIADADYNPDANVLLVLCEDRHLRIINVDSGRTNAELAYERWPATQIIGRPKRCALVFQDAVANAFFATDRGYIACWKPDRGEVLRMQDYTVPGLFVFDALAESAKLYVSDRHGGTVAREYSESIAALNLGAIARHKTGVNSCGFTADGDIVSACYRESTLMWSSCDLRLSHVSVLPSLTAMAAASESNSIVIGDGYGRVYRVSASQPDGSGHFLGSLALDEAVRCVVCDGPIHAIASDSRGRLVRVSLEFPGPPQTLRPGGPLREQIDLLSAGSGGNFWSLRLDSSDGGQRQSVLSLLERSGEEVVLLSRVRDLDRIAAAENGYRLCTFGTAVRVLQRTQSGLREQYRRDAAALRVAFVCAGEFLAVVPPGRPSIEIWRVSEGLPTVGSCSLRSTVECLATTKHRVVAGLISGELISLTIAGTSVPPPEQ